MGLDNKSSSDSNGMIQLHWITSIQSRYFVNNVVVILHGNCKFHN